MMVILQLLLLLLLLLLLSLMETAVVDQNFSHRDAGASQKSIPFCLSLSMITATTTQQNNNTTTTATTTTTTTVFLQKMTTGDSAIVGCWRNVSFANTGATATSDDISLQSLVDG